jgi:hypothetical protein
MIMKRLLLLSTLLLAGFTMAEPVFAQSGMSASCRRAYAQYNRARGPKAFAHGQNDACGFGYAPNIQRARSLAIGYCRQYRGVDCSIREDVY